MTLLLVDEDTRFARALGSELERTGECQVLTADTPSAAMRLVSNEGIHCVVSGLALTTNLGLPLLLFMAAMHPHIPVVVLDDNPHGSGSDLSAWYGAAATLPRRSSADEVWSRLDQTHTLTSCLPGGHLSGGSVLPTSLAAAGLLTEENTMAIEELFADIRTTNGYLAGGLMTFTGDLIYAQSNDATIDVEVVGATLNDIFRNAHAASIQLTGNPCRELIIQTPAVHIIMNCSGVDSLAHVHSIVVVKSDGNRTLMELHVKKMLPKAMEEVA